jgi:hypothetical protein
MTKSSFAILAAAFLMAPSLASAQFVDSKGNKTGKARHDIAKRCAVSAGIPIHADGSWNEGSPEALAKYRACKQEQHQLKMDARPPQLAASFIQAGDIIALWQLTDLDAQAENVRG